MVRYECFILPFIICEQSGTGAPAGHACFILPFITHNPSLIIHMYLAKLGDFTFTLEKASLESLRHNQTFAFAKQERLLDHPHHQPTGQWEDSFELMGTLHLQKLQGLEKLQALAQAKKPLIFVTGYGKIFGKVIIESLSMEQAIFLKNGEFLKQSFTLRLQKIYD